MSLSVGEGHTLALLGPSGCGKTTILRCIAGLETPEQGHISIAGRVVFDAASGINLKPEQRELGVVFQSYAVWPHMTVAENVGFPLKVRKRAAGRAARPRRAHPRDRRPGAPGTTSRRRSLSGGQQQRVALARALVYEPRLVLFDEPMSNLDAQLRDQMRIELKILQDRLGFTAIYVTHDQAEAFALAENVVLMNRGKVETAGAPREVSYRPRTPFVARFLGLNVRGGRAIRTGDLADRALLCRGGAVRPADAARPDRRRDGRWRRARRCWPASARSTSRSASCRPAALPRHGALIGEVRAASFLGAEEEYVLDLDGVELRAIQAPIGAAGRRPRSRSPIRPENCTCSRDR